MKGEFKKTRVSLLCLAERIEKGDYPHNRRDFGGADVVITSETSKPTEGGFYPDPRYVVTPFSHELSWLFEEMRDMFASFLDGCNKIEFYGRLANMANRYKKRLKGKKENEKDLLLAVLHETFAILEEMEEGNFQFLMVAVGNTIFDDIIERAESEGYLGVDETQKFFKEMEKKHHDA